MEHPATVNKESLKGCSYMKDHSHNFDPQRTLREDQHRNKVILSSVMGRHANLENINSCQGLFKSSEVSFLRCKRMGLLIID